LTDITVHLNKSESQSPDASYQVWLNLAHWFLKKLTDGRCTMPSARCANNYSECTTRYWRVTFRYLLIRFWFVIKTFICNLIKTVNVKKN